MPYGFACYYVVCLLFVFVDWCLVCFGLLLVLLFAVVFCCLVGWFSCLVAFCDIVIASLGVCGFSLLVLLSLVWVCWLACWRLFTFVVVIVVVVLVLNSVEQFELLCLV